MVGLYRLIIVYWYTVIKNSDTVITVKRRTWQSSMRCYLQRKRRDETGMCTYTCKKTDDNSNEKRERERDEEKPVRRNLLSGIWHKQNQKNELIIGKEHHRA